MGFKMDFIITAVLVIVTGYTTADANCGDLTFYSREDWGARDPVCEEDMPIPVTYIFIHHTATSECNDFEECAVQMRAIQNMHMDSNEWCDIGYNFLIGGDGAVYTARGWDKVGAHTFGYNDIAVAFSLMGNFEVSPVPQNMLDTAQALIECATGEAGALEDLYSLHGHKDSRCTACPGVYLYDEISSWLYFNRLEVDFIC